MPKTDKGAGPNRPRPAADAETPDVRAQVQHIDEIDFAGWVAQSNYVARTPVLLPKGLNGVLDAAGREITQERIARAERQKSERGPSLSLRFGKEAVYNFVRGAIASDGEKIPISLCISRAGQRCGLTRSARLSDFEFDARMANALECCARELAAASASGRRIDDREKARVHGCRTSFEILRTELTGARPLRG